MSDDLDAIFGEIDDETYRRALTCEHCGHSAFVGRSERDEAISDYVHVRCEHHCCVLTRCIQCSYYHGGWGPADCPCDCDEAEYERNESMLARKHERERGERE